MKKIGILTFHYANNYGAVLQCYALNKVLSGFSECEVEVINYIPPQFCDAEYGASQWERKKIKEKKELLVDFLKKYCKVATKEVVAHVEGEQYDYYCVGSDQVWNTQKIFQEYFLPYIKDNAKKISYAASIGVSVTSNGLNRNTLEKYLPDFQHISVRELEHTELISEITGKECPCVLDPTLLLQSSEYELLINKEKLEEEEYVFFFWLKHDDNLMRGVELVNSLARKYNLKIIHSIMNAREHMFCNENRCMMFEGIENFLWYVKNAKFVVTNSYHVSIFSILFETPFYILLVELMRSRFDTLATKLGIGDRIIECYISIDKISSNIDFKLIKDKIETEKKKSIDYLMKAIDIG